MVKFGKVVLKGVRDGAYAERAEVFLRLEKDLKIPLTGLKSIRSGYLAMTETEHDLDKLFSTKATVIFKKLGLQTSVPPKVRAQRSVICRQVDSYVGEHLADELKTEINRCNQSIQAVENNKDNQYHYMLFVKCCLSLLFY